MGLGSNPHLSQHSAFGYVLGYDVPPHSGLDCIWLVPRWLDEIIPHVKRGTTTTRTFFRKLSARVCAFMRSRWDELLANAGRWRGEFL